MLREREPAEIFTFGSAEYDLTIEADVIRMYKEAFDTLEQSMPALTKKVLLPGAGHWVQQEQAEQVSRLLLDFLRTHSG